MEEFMVKDQMFLGIGAAGATRRRIRQMAAEIREYLIAFLEESAGGGQVRYEGFRNSRLVFRLTVRDRYHLPLVAEDFCRRSASCIGCGPENVLANHWSVRILVPVG